MSALRLILSVILAGVIALPAPAGADEPHTFGPSVRISADNDDEEKVDREVVDAAYRGAQHGLRQLSVLARSTARQGFKDEAVEVYRAVIDHPVTPDWFAVAMSVEKAIVESSAQQPGKAITTLNRAHQRAHDIQSIPLWRTTRYLRTAVLATRGELDDALDLYACDDQPHGPAETFLCRRADDFDFDPRAFADHLVTNGLFYPNSRDPREADEFGLRLVVEPLLYAAHAQGNPPHYFLPDRSPGTVDPELLTAYAELYDIYRDRGDTDGMFRVHLTVAHHAIDAERAAAHLKKAEQLFDGVAHTSVVRHDLAMTRARTCLETEIAEDCAVEIRDARPPGTVPDDRRARHAALCRDDIDQSGLSFCESALEYFTEDASTKLELVAAKLAISHRLDDDDATLRLLERLETIVDHTLLQTLDYQVTLPILRRHCRASTELSPDDAPWRCQRLIDEYRRVSDDAMNADFFDGLLADLEELARAHHARGSADDAVRTLEVRTSLATAGTEPRHAIAMESLASAGDVHFHDRDAYHQAAEAFAQAIDHAERLDDIGVDELDRLYQRWFASLEHAERWHYLERRTARILDESEELATELRATTLLFQALAAAHRDEREAACDALRGVDALERNERHHAIEERVVEALGGRCSRRS